MIELPPKQLPKPDEVNILGVSPVAIPVTSAVGQMQVRVQVFGNGDDNKLYVWDGEKKVWLAA